MINLFISKMFKTKLNSKTLKRLKFPLNKVMIIDPNFNFKLLNDLANILGIKVKCLSISDDDDFLNFVLKNTNIKGEIEGDFLFYQTKDIKKYSSIIKPNYIIINELGSYLEIKDFNVKVIANKETNVKSDITYSLNDKNATFYISNIDYIKENITINKKITLNFNLEKELNSILMLFSLFSYFKDENQLITAFNTLNSKKFVYFNKTFFFDINNINFKETIKFIGRYTDYKILVIGWNIANNDISWLYNIEFEKIKNKNIQKIYCIGANAYDLACRFKYADFKNIVASPNIDVVLKDIKCTNSNIYVISDPIFKEILGGK